MERIRRLQPCGSVAVLVSAAFLFVVRTAGAQTQIPNCEISVVDGARLNNNSNSAAGLSASAVDGRLRLGRRVEFADNTSVSGAFVGLGNGASVFDVNADVLKAGRGATVRGVKGPFVGGGGTCDLPDVVCGGQNVFLRRGDVPRSLSPGTYGTLNLENGTSLTLAPGVYTFCSIKTGRHVKLTVAGATQSTINVAGDVELGNATSLQPANGTPTPLLNVAGDAVHVGAGSDVRAFITAPNARLTLGRASTLTGAACARSFGSGRNVSVECAPDQSTSTTTTSSTSSTSTSTTSTTTTTTTTLGGACGNGVKDAGEQCDSGSPGGGFVGGTCGFCTSDCTCECGNGVKDPGEQCDSGSPGGGFVGGTCGFCNADCTCTPGTTTTTTSVPSSTTTTTAASTTTTTAVVTTSTSSTVPTTTSSTSSTTILPTTSTTTTSTTSSTTSSSTSSTVVPTTTTTTTTTPGATRLAFTNSPGTTNCGGITGGVSFTPAASAPFSGEIDSDLACTTKIADLGLGCLYIGGGGATTVPPGATPDGATNIFDISGSNLLASNGTSNLNCTKGAGPGKHCIAGTNTGTACTADANCGGTAGSCALDANCFFAAPLPIPNGSLSTCVVNVIQTDASGTLDITTGASSVAVPLSSRVYITSNSASPCPKCVSGTCNAGLNATKACSAGSNSLGTSQDCPPLPANFISPLAVSLSPLTTGAVQKTGAGGNFCPSPPAATAQRTNGAFGKITAQCIKEAGSPAGDLSDGLPHPSKLASVFCIPKTGNPAIDPAADLPGPGAFSITGDAQALP